MAEPVRKPDKLTPFAMCDECARLFTAAFALKKVSRQETGIGADGGGGLVVCANCKRRRPGAKYVKEA